MFEAALIVLIFSFSFLLIAISIGILVFIFYDFDYEFKHIKENKKTKFAIPILSGIIGAFIGIAIAHLLGIL